MLVILECEIRQLPNRMSVLDKPSGSKRIEELLWDSFKEGGLEQLYTYFFPIMLNHGTNLGKPESLVKDCIQDIFLDLIYRQRNGTLITLTNPRWYLLRSLQYQLRVKLDKKETATSHLDKSSQLKIELSTCNDPIVLDRLVNNESPFWSTFFKLPKKYQTALRLYYVEDWSQKKLAKFMGFNSTAAVGMLIMRAKVAFKKL